VRPKAGRGKTRRQVAELLATGLSFAEVAAALAVSKPTVSYHARQLGIGPLSKFSRRYDWSEVQRYYDAGHSVTECQLYFGFARKTFVDAAKRGEITTRPQAMPIEALLSAPRNRTHLKKRLIAAGLKVNRCEVCGLTDWLDRPFVHGASSRQRGWLGQPAREPSVAVPQLPFADRQLLGPWAAAARGGTGPCGSG
jgi:hypothetical protein